MCFDLTHAPVAAAARAAATGLVSMYLYRQHSKKECSPTAKLTLVWARQPSCRWNSFVEQQYAHLCIENTINSSGAVGRWLSPWVDFSLSIDHDSRAPERFAEIAFFFYFELFRRIFNRTVSQFRQFERKCVDLHILRASDGHWKKPHLVSKQTANLLGKYEQTKHGFSVHKNSHIKRTKVNMHQR